MQSPTVTLRSRPPAAEHSQALSMQATRVYVDQLRVYATRALQGDLASGDFSTVSAELDGRFGRYIDRRVPRAQRRLAGAFFTGSAVADAMVAPLAKLLAE